MVDADLRATAGGEAAAFYVSLLPNSTIAGSLSRSEVTPGGPEFAGTTVTVDFELDGRPFTAINGDPHPDRARRATEAMLATTKFDIGAIRAAADGR